MILLRLFQESKNIIFTCAVGTPKTTRGLRHSWFFPSPLVKTMFFTLLSPHSNTKFYAIYFYMLYFLKDTTIDVAFMYKAVTSMLRHLEPVGHHLDHYDIYCRF
jgi:hypothetical protein